MLLGPVGLGTTVAFKGRFVHVIRASVWPRSTSWRVGQIQPTTGVEITLLYMRGGKGIRRQFSGSELHPSNNWKALALAQNEMERSSRYLWSLLFSCELPSGSFISEFHQLYVGLCLFKKKKAKLVPKPSLKTMMYFCPGVSLKTQDKYIQNNNLLNQRSLLICCKAHLVSWGRGICVWLGKNSVRAL